MEKTFAIREVKLAQRMSMQELSQERAMAMREVQLASAQSFQAPPTTQQPTPQEPV